MGFRSGLLKSFTVLHPWMKRTENMMPPNAASGYSHARYAHHSLVTGPAYQLSHDVLPNQQVGQVFKRKEKIHTLHTKNNNG